MSLPRISSLFLVTLAVVSVSGLSIIPAVGSSSVASCTPDFTLSISRTTGTVERGSSTGFGISIASVCKLVDSIGWGVGVTSPTPKVTCNNKNVCTSNGPTIHQNTYTVVLTSTHTSGTGSFAVSASADTLLTTYTLTVSARDVTHCCLSHSLNITVTVDDFTVTANPTSVKVSAGQNANSAITVTSLNGFTGTIYYSDNMPSPGVPPLGCSLEPSQPTLSSTTTSVTSILSCSGAKGTYTVTVSGSPYSGLPVRTATITITVT